MCGIAGWLGHEEKGTRLSGLMTDALRHRGPDAQGARAWQDCGLIHTRLSILDLTPSGEQPMANEDGTVWTVFNGEIYNHHELRRDLQAKGHRFRGHADTEVIPHLYEECGSGFVSRMKGIFACAVYDTNTRTLVLARDRFGVKPLYYGFADGSLYFASEINALRNVQGLDMRPDPQAIFDFAALCFIPGPATFFKGIRSLAPGSFLKAMVTGHGVDAHSESYHRWCIAPDTGLTLEAAAGRVEELLYDAVGSQLESNVPLGSLLSGGIDSSLVSAAAQKRDSCMLRTFNVRFAGSAYDETPLALMVSRHIGSRHETMDIGEFRGTWDNVVSLLRHAGQPFADTSFFAVNAISRVMRRQVTVALSGDGGDEGFGGYQMFAQLGLISEMSRVPRWLADPALAALGAASLFSPRVERIRRRLQEFPGADPAAVLEALHCWVHGPELKRLCRPLNALPVRRHFERQWDHEVSPGSTPLEELSALATEVRTRLLLPDDYLFKVDMASMREGLEVRVPFLDEDLFSFALQLPHKLKVHGRRSKRVLRTVASRLLPADVVTSPKHGFDMPLREWVDEGFKKQLQAAVRRSCLSEYFDAGIYLPWVDAFCNGRTIPGMSDQGLSQRVIMVLSLHLALE